MIAWADGALRRGVTLLIANEDATGIFLAVVRWLECSILGDEVAISAAIGVEARPRCVTMVRLMGQLAWSYWHKLGLRHGRKTWELP